MKTLGTPPARNSVEIDLDDAFYEIIKKAKWNLEGYILSAIHQRVYERDHNPRIWNCKNFFVGMFLMQREDRRSSKDCDGFRKTDADAYRLMESLVEAVKNNGDVIPEIKLYLNIEDYEDIMYWSKTSSPEHLGDLREIQSHLLNKSKIRKQKKRGFLCRRS